MTLDEARAVAYDKLGVCGCAEPEALELLGECLRRMGGNGPEGWDELVASTFSGNESAAYCAHFLLENAELMDHGVSIRYGFLTPEGNEFLAAYNTFGAAKITGDDQ